MTQIKILEYESSKKSWMIINIYSDSGRSLGLV